MKNIILGVVFFVAIACIAYFFIVEGFDPTVNAGDAVRAACEKNSTCSKCLATSNCGWASEYAAPAVGVTGVADGTVLACIPQNGGQPFITPNLANLMIKLKGARSTVNKFITSLGDCTDITCTANTKCGDCATYKKCTWQQVSAADGTISQSCIDLSGAAPADTTHNNITDKSKCPPPQCSDLTDCQECANTTGCNFCASSGKCLKESEFGPGANQCPTASKITVPAMCPCGGITDCGKCATRVGCAYCKGIKQCVNLDKFGMPPAGTCTQDDTATRESQCSASSQPPKMPDSPPPTEDNLSAAQNSGIIDRTAGFDLSAPGAGAGSGPVSPSTSYKVVTAPGVARAVGSNSVPATVKHDMEIGNGSPLESYVKMLVNSQLAAQGVPTNEPFQTLEAAAIPNASDYMKKVFRGVFH